MADSNPGGRQPQGSLALQAQAVTPASTSCLHVNLSQDMDLGREIVAFWLLLAGHGVAKSRTRLSDFTLTFHFHAWEKKMATHSSILP